MSSERVPISEPDSGVIQSPDGEIQYYSKIQNKHNPYLHKSPLDEEEDGIEYTEIYCGGDTVLIPTQDVNRAVELECRGCVVRFLCLLDFMINLLVSFNSVTLFQTYYAACFSAFIACVSLMGYYSTQTYNRKGLVLYLAYQYMQSLAKISILTIYIIAAVSPDIRYKIENQYNDVNLTPAVQNIIIFSVSTIGQVYITYFIQRFYNMLPGPRIRVIRSDDH